jgi:rubrerythrin
MDSALFVDQLLKEVMDDQEEKKRQIRLEGLDEQAELPEFVIKHWLNFAVYYEKAATYFIADWLKTTKEPDAFVNFAHQIRDEANHYVWLRKYLQEYTDPDAFTPPKEWRYLMEEYYPGLDHLVERLAAHNIASESAALGFMEFALERFPESIRNTVEKVAKDEHFHVSFGCTLLKKYCTTPELQERALKATREAMKLMRQAREVFVQI